MNKTGCPLFLPATIWLFSFALATLGNETLLRCKYSVRDVAFVNVHGKSWQLDLVKPNRSDFDVETHNEILRAQLERSNLGFVWHNHDSQQAKQLGSTGDRSTDQPSLFLTDREGTTIPIGMAGKTFASRVKQLIVSPGRTQLLDRLSESLCVFVLVRGPDESKNRAARRTLDEAAEQLEKQMWTLEKASSQGPSVVEFSFDDSAERTALQSIGFDLDNENVFPSVAIMFGQARRMGDIIPAAQLDKQKLVALASICGSDCECALDRDWLYGAQMVHRWTVAHERKAEANLDFDPQSAFVMAEIAQILQKNTGTLGGENLINLGAGLVIHDLPPTTDKTDTNETLASENETSPNRDSDLDQQSGMAELPDNETAHRTASTIPEPDSPAPPVELNEVPWFLFAGLAMIVVAIVILRFRNH